MSDPMGYLVPACEFHRAESLVVNSRFITTIGFADTVEAARSFLAKIRAEMPDASHHVHAFRIGFGNSVTDGLSDDGEPSGTAGPPVMSVLRGAGIGDIIIVVTRYFGGTKLGTGGLVRAYSDAARLGLATLPTIRKIVCQTIGIEVSYALYERVKRLAAAYEATIQHEIFTGEITLIISIPDYRLSVFSQALFELSNGRIQPLLLS
jgi:uncharacterized YigZ family protein